MPQRSDMYNLYPARAQVNGARGSRPCYDIPDAETDAWYYLDMTRSTIRPSDIDQWSESDNDADVFEPREEVKGDVARLMLYFYVLYPESADEEFFGEQICTLVNWARQDEVFTRDVLRAARIERYQGNVSPFVIDPTPPDRLFRIVEDAEQGEQPVAYRVEAVYPNPFRSETQIALTVSRTQHIVLGELATTVLRALRLLALPSLVGHVLRRRCCKEMTWPNARGAAAAVADVVAR